MAAQKKVEITLLKQLYFEEQLSAPQVAKELGVALSTVYDNMIAHNLARRSPQETNKLRFEKMPTSFSLKTTNLSITEERLMVAGLMLYAAEGARSNKKTKNFTVDFANSNPRLIKIFLAFLKQICRVDEARLRLYLFCYPNQDSQELRRFWSNLTGISLNQFTKPYVRKYCSKKNEGVLRYGLLHIRYADKRLLYEIEKLIKEYSQTV